MLPACAQEAGHKKLMLACYNLDLLVLALACALQVLQRCWDVSCHGKKHELLCQMLRMNIES